MPPPPAPTQIEPQPPAVPEIPSYSLSDLEMSSDDEMEYEMEYEQRATSIYDSVQARLQELFGKGVEKPVDPFASPDGVPFGTRGLIEPRVGRLGRVIFDRTMGVSRFAPQTFEDQMALKVV